MFPIRWNAATTNEKRFQPQMTQMPADAIVHHNGTTTITERHGTCTMFGTITDAH
jgi:hypothetical protein